MATRLTVDCSRAFPSGAASVTEQQIYTALAAFQTSLVSLNSRYDRYVHGHDAALSEREIEGLNVFRSFVARCSECHTPPLFTNEQIAVIGAPEPDGRPFDVGAEAIFGSAKLKGGFKVPTLRNITRTGPYMHSGAFTELRDAVEFYNKGRGNAVPQGHAALSALAHLGAEAHRCRDRSDRRFSGRIDGRDVPAAGTGAGPVRPDAADTRRMKMKKVILGLLAVLLAFGAGRTWAAAPSRTS